MKKPKQDIQNLPDDLTFITLSKICSMLDKNPATIYRWVASGKFPAPAKLGGNSVGWNLVLYKEWASDPQAWAAAHARAA